MIAASVGFHCPDDVQAASKGVRQARTALGGRLTSDGRVTTTLIAANVAVYALGVVVPHLDLRFGGLASTVGADDGTGQVTLYRGIADGAYYRLITAAFLHAGLFHLFANMFALLQIGPVLERALGRTRFLTLYLLSALGGSTLSMLLSQPNQLGVGASGAIFGVFGAYYVVVRRLGGDTRSILTLLAINLVITFAVPIIDWRAHIGGLVTGAALAAAFAYAPVGPRRATLQIGACVAVAALLAVLVGLRTVALSS